jgi:hypothetical protein
MEWHFRKCTASCTDQLWCHNTSILHCRWANYSPEVTCAALPELVWMRMGSFARIMVNGIFYVSFVLTNSVLSCRMGGELNIGWCCSGFIHRWCFGRQIRVPSWSPDECTSSFLWYPLKVVTWFCSMGLAPNQRIFASKACTTLLFLLQVWGLHVLCLDYEIQPPICSSHVSLTLQKVACIWEDIHCVVP